MKKSGIISIVAACLMLTTAFAAACTDGGNEVAAGEVVMEAEGIDLSELSGRGYSNEAKGCGMIMGLNTKYLREDEKISKSISNGYFVGYFNTADTTMTFEFTSDPGSQRRYHEIASRFGVRHAAFRSFFHDDRRQRDGVGLR